MKWLFHKTTVHNKVLTISSRPCYGRTNEWRAESDSSEMKQSELMHP